MRKLGATFDTSFWNNAYRIEVYQYLPRFFDIVYCSNVVAEIEAPNPRAPSLVYPNTQAFMVMKAHFAQRDPANYPGQFGPGEAQAMALAVEAGLWLLLDDARPYQYARQVLGLTVIHSAAFAVWLYQQRLISHRAVQHKLDLLQYTLAPDFLALARRIVARIVQTRGEA